jgi:LAGLIDADG DNA endonuclease family protein
MDGLLPTRAWDANRVRIVRDAFQEFLPEVIINSKETGPTRLIDRLYRAQHAFYSGVFDALEQDIHNIYVLKSRQLGLSTSIRPLIVFWAGIHDGLQGTMVYNTAFNTSAARREVVGMIRALPARLHFPGIVSDNREGLVLENGSQILFMAAGLKSGKTSGGLGRSIGLNLGHFSELSSWVNDQGLISLKQSLSEEFPDRLYVWESTAIGYNLWYKEWKAAEQDDLACRTMFFGWWSKDTQEIAAGTAEFARYGMEPPTPKEIARIDAVRSLYGWEITPGQLAWYRRKIDPTQEMEEGDPEDSIMMGEQPWIAEEAFQLTGADFFQSDRLAEAAAEIANRRLHPQCFRFVPGLNFVDSQIFPSRTRREIDLRVWEEPVQDGVYVIAGDPAFGHDEKNANSCAQVMRGYADGIDQIAEFASASIQPHHFAWLLWTLIGYFGAKPGARVLMICEINGPGEEVWRQYASTKLLVQQGYLRGPAREKGIADIFANVSSYIYQRSDSMNTGHVYQWKCLALDTPIPTPAGWTRMGEVEIGNIVFDDLGQRCRVTGTSPVQLGRDCYRVTFDDKSSIVADADHLWEIDESKEGYEKKRVVPTIELRENTAITVAQPLELPDLDLPVHPYALGVWLGDGYSKMGRICGGHADLVEILQHLSKFGYTPGIFGIDKRTGLRSTHLSRLHRELQQEKLLMNKHIPPQFLRGSYEQRLWLLQGLMDTDGSIVNRQASFTTTRERIADGFAELIRSLGMKAKFCVRNRNLVVNGESRVCETAYQFVFTPYDDTPPFRLARKRDRVGRRVSPRLLRSRRHKVVSVERVPSVPVRCIAVDSPSRLYLAGFGMVPTHNTNTQNKIQILEAERNYLNNRVFRVSSMDLLEEMKTITRDGDTIGAEGADRDDRVFAAALGIRAWDEKLRRNLVATNRTREAERARLSVTIEDQAALWQRNTLEMFFKDKQRKRADEMRALMRSGFRYAPRRRLPERRF